MVFSISKRELLREHKQMYFSTFVYALITAALLFVPYMFFDNGYFLFYGDYNVQQIPFYQHCHAAVKSGNIGWDFFTDLGTDFLGSYSFYLLDSPFFWLTIPFPNSFVPYLVAPLLIIKFAFSALTAYCYIRRFTRRADSARLGALLYAFSGFSVYNIFFNHFHEPIVFFPLLLLSVELLLTENRRGLFALAVAVCAISNYFFFFGMVIFTVIYFIVRLYSKAIKITVGRFLIFAFEAVIGLLMAAILLLPSIAIISSNSRLSEILLGWNAITYGKEQIYLNIIQCFFFPPDIPARPVFFPGADVKWSSLGGWLPLFSMVGVFALFINKKQSWIKRVITVCIVMALVPFLNSAFYGFNTAYYARWYYMPILLMCLATAMLTEENGINWSSGYKWTLGITITFAAVIGFFPQKDTDGNLIFGLYTQDDSYIYAARFFIAVAIALISLLVLGLLLKLIKTDRTLFYKGATICVIIISIIYGNVYIACGRSHSYDIGDVMIDSLIEGEVKLDDADNYRIDTYECVDNTAMYLGYQSINAFHSIVPGSVMEFYDFIGEERMVASRPSTKNYALRSLLSVKYLLNRKDGESFIDKSGTSIMTGYKYLSTQDGYYVYENENYIPYGFSYNYYMSYEYCESFSKSSRASLMLKAILLTDKQIEKYKDYLTDLKSLETYNADATTTLGISEESFHNDCAELKKTSAQIFKINKNGFRAEVIREDKNLVFFSIPYSDGWSATVNGKKVEIEKVNVGFMAVPVDKGVSVIEFTYETPFLSEGILITLISLCIFLVYFIFSRIVIEPKAAELSYPEGDELLLLWQTQEKDEIRNALSARLEDVTEYNEPSSLQDEETSGGFQGGFKIDIDGFNDKNDIDNK